MICKGKLVVPYNNLFRQLKPDPMRTDMPHVYVHVDRDIPPDQLSFR